MREVDLDVFVSLDEGDRLLERREHAQTQEIDLDDAHVRTVVLVPLNDAPVDHRRGLDRDDLVEAAGGDHDPAAVLSEVAGQALDRAHEIDPVLHVRRLRIELRLAQARQELALDLGLGVLAAGLGRRVVLASFAGATSRHRREVEPRDQLREPPDRLGILPQDLAHLPDRHLDPVRDHVRGHRRPRDPVLPEDVLDHFLALVAGGQVDVDVGPLAALLREEALEEEVHSDWVDRRDAQRITHGAVGGGAAALTENPMDPGIRRDVLDDQEVAGEVELLDDVELGCELFQDAGAGTRAVAGARADTRELVQAAHLRLAWFEGEGGEAVVEVLEGELAALLDRPRAEDPLRAVAEAPHDLLSGVEIALAVGRQVATRRVEGLPLPQTDQRVEQPPFLRPRTAHVSRRDDRDPSTLRHVRRMTPDPFRPAVEGVGYVDGEAVAEGAVGTVEQAGVQSLVPAYQHTPVSRLGFELVPTYADQVARPGVPGLEGLVPSRMGPRDHPAESPPALRRFAEQRHPVRRGEPVGPTPIADGNRASHQRAQPRLLGRLVETGGAGDAVPVRQGEGLVAAFRGSLDQVLRVATGLEEGEGASGAEFDVVTGGGHDLFSSYFRH